MDFKGFNLTPQAFSPKTFSSAKMGEEHLYSYPLSGHLEGGKPFHSVPWTYLNPTNITHHLKMAMPLGIVPQQSKMCDIKKNVLSYVVGGFVGSKSQRNCDKQEPFPIGDVIVDLLEQGPKQKKVKSPANSSQFVETMMSNIFMGLTGQTDGSLLQGFAMEVPENQKEQSVFRRDSAEDTCLSRALRLLSECSVDSNDSDLVVFEGTAACILTDDEDDWTDDSDFECDDEPVDERLQEATEKWNRFYGDDALDDPCNPSKVQFAANPVVHIMCVWDFAHRAARMGPWEEAARDRARFKDRIRRTEEVIAPVLEQDHRVKVWSRLNEDR